MKKIGVIGAGTMGSGIAQKIAQEGYEVILVDIKDEFLERGLDRIKKTLEEGVQRKLFTEDDVKEILSRIKPTLSYEDLKDSDLVIEAVFEDKKVKDELFRKLDEICDEKTVFATNTSSLSVNELSESVKRKDRFLGMHFFYHPAKNRFLEVIPGNSTENDILNDVLLFSKSIGKVYVIAKDAPGFVVNRFFVPWLNEACRIYEEGIANIITIDEVCKKLFGVPMGPFALMNATGVPIAYHASKFLAEKLGKFYEPAEILKKQAEKKENWKIEGEVDSGKFEDVKKRMLGAVFYVVCEMLDHNVCEIEDIEKGAKVALRWRKGPFEIMNDEGFDKVNEYIEEIKEKYSLSKPSSFEKQFNVGKWKIRNVIKEVKNGTGFIIISRPERMNALDYDIFKELNESIDELLENKDVQKIVIEGEGKAFVAGADIKFFIENIEKKDFDRIVEFTKFGHNVLKKIENSEKPFICKLTGFALGGGAELALSCKSIVAVKSAYLAFPETGIGIYPGLGGTQRLPRIIGKELAKYFIFTGFPIDAELGKKLGIIEEVIDIKKMDEWVNVKKEFDDKYKRKKEIPEELKIIEKQFSDENIPSLLKGEVIDEENKLLQKVKKVILSKAPIALKIANELIDKGLSFSLEEGLELELSYLEKIFKTEDAYEGLKSVLERRRPGFKGR